MCGSAFAWPSAFSRGVLPLQVIISPRCVVLFSPVLSGQAHHLHGSTEPGPAARGRLDRRKSGCPVSFHGFHLFHLSRTLRVQWKRRLPPARERLAKHSGDGSGAIVGMDAEGGDEKGVKLLIWLSGFEFFYTDRRRCGLPPPLTCRPSLPARRGLEMPHRRLTRCILG